MFLEKRTVGESTKYYLVHKYRDEHNKVKNLREYLGSNLTSEQIIKRRKTATKKLEKILEKRQQKIFTFSLTPKQLASLNAFDAKITVEQLGIKEWEQFTQDFVYNTNAIEGSTVQLDEVTTILAKKRNLSDEEKETKGLDKAIRHIRFAKGTLNKKFMLKLHKYCFKNTKDYAGKYRDVEVVIRNRKGEVIHQGVPAKELEEKLDEFVAWYKEHKNKLKPLLLAAIVHNQFEHIHPFQDGNGRVGRLLLNYVLLQHKYPPINILLTDRAQYYYTLHEYSTNHQLRPTMEFLIAQYKKTLRGLRKKKT